MRHPLCNASLRPAPVTRSIHRVGSAAANLALSFESAQGGCCALQGHFSAAWRERRQRCPTSRAQHRPRRRGDRGLAQAEPGAGGAGAGYGVSLCRGIVIILTITSAPGQRQRPRRIRCRLPRRAGGHVADRKGGDRALGGGAHAARGPARGP